MGKSSHDPDRKEKKDKKKHKHSDENGVVKHKHKKDRTDSPVTHVVAERTAVDPDGTVVAKDVQIKEERETEDGETEKLQIRVRKEKDIPVGAMVPFANPLADDKTLRRVLRNVKRSAKHKALKRGVKEVVKALRKSPMPSSSATSGLPPPAVVVLAADISPMDVISHIPVLCEDHSVPYIYVPSRAELGAASSTKRPTSVVMMMPKPGKRKPTADGAEAQDEDKESWEEIYADTSKMVEKAGRHVKI